MAYLTKKETKRQMTLYIEIQIRTTEETRQL